jgi:hypothetical protein
MYKNYDIPNRIKQSSQCCIYCGKSYKNRINLDKHTTFCELIYKTTKKRKLLVIEDEQVPSQKNMYKALLSLAQKFINLEEKVEDMNKFIVKRKKRMNIIEWLNTNITPDLTFNQLNEKIIVTENDVDYLFKNTVYDTFNQIFDKSLYILKNSEKSSPLFAFIQRSNVLYVYLEQENTENTATTIDITHYKWQELSRDKLILFLYNIHNKLSRQLYYWKQKRNNEMNKNEQLAIEYDKTILKLMLTDFKKESILSKFRCCIYKYMKTDIRGLVEYEFEF